MYCMKKNYKLNDNSLTCLKYIYFSFLSLMYLYCLIIEKTGHNKNYHNIQVFTFSLLVKNPFNLSVSDTHVFISCSFPLSWFILRHGKYTSKHDKYTRQHTRAHIMNC